MTQVEKTIHALEVELATLKAHIETLRGETKPITEYSNQIAILQTQVAELTKAKEFWGQRGWAILTVSISASLSLAAALLVALLTYLLRPKS